MNIIEYQSISLQPILSNMIQSIEIFLAGLTDKILITQYLSVSFYVTFTGITKSGSFGDKAYSPLCDIYLAQSQYLTTNSKYIFYKYSQLKQDLSWPLLCKIYINELSYYSIFWGEVITVMWRQKYIYIYLQKYELCMRSNYF